MFWPQTFLMTNGRKERHERVKSMLFTRELVKHLANRLIAISVKGLDALVSNLSNDLYLE